jgi:hypothetical protein
VNTKGWQKKITHRPEKLKNEKTENIEEILKFFILDHFTIIT